MGNLLLDIITTAAILFVVASGLLMILGVMKLINFAHGAFLTVGAYTAYVATAAGLNPWVSIPLALIVGIAGGLLIERLIIRWLYDRPLDAILATWGLAIIIQQLIVFVFGREVQFAASPMHGTIGILGIKYSIYRLVVSAIAIFTAIALTALLYATRFGLNARAVIMNENLASGLGIDSRRVRAVTFGLGTGLVAAAGALITPLISVNPEMGLPWLINSFMLVLVSGVSIPSLFLASLILGGAQVIVSTYVNSIVGGITIVVLAAVILRVNPRGISLA